jgi:amino acid permease
MSTDETSSPLEPEVAVIVQSDEEKEKLSTIGGALAIISTILGGGIVGLPYAIYLLGLPLGILLNLVVDYISYESGMMYMALRTRMPG